MATADNGETNATGGTSEEQSALSRGDNPATVLSLSSLDTAPCDYNDATSLPFTNDHNTQQSTHPYPLPPMPTSSSPSDDHSLSFSHSYLQADSSQSQQQQPQSHQLSSHLTTSSGPLMGQATMRLSPTTRVVVPAAPTVNTVPEFLCSLTKMLTDNNRDIIEWSNGKLTN
jgi:hypothetical protein